MAKDRAAPFSRKHRRYWIPVTGGMLLIGVINLSIGYCYYEAPRDSQPIQLVIPKRDAAASDSPGTLAASQLPAAVMRAFAIKYPKTIPASAVIEAGNYVVLFPAGAAHKRAVFREDGTFVSDD